MTRPGPKRREVDLDRLRELAAKGLTRETMASLLGVSIRTFYERQVENPQISQAINEGRAKLADEMADRLLQKALAGDTRACMFFLDRRCGWNRRDERTINHNVTVDPKAELERIEQKLIAAGYDLEELKRIKRRPAATIEHETVQ